MKHASKKNPLSKNAGYSAKHIGDIISQEVTAGIPHAQAVAIAYRQARKNYRKKHPTGPFPKHLQGVGKFYKKNPPKKPMWSYWFVDRKNGNVWEPVAAFKHNKKKEAVEYAKAYGNQHNKQMKVYRL